MNAPIIRTVGASPKMVGGTVGGLGVGLLLALLNGQVADASLIPGVPDWVQGIILVLAPTLVSFLTTYLPGPGAVNVAAGGKPPHVEDASYTGNHGAPMDF